MAREGRARTRLDPEIRRELIVEASETVFAVRDPAEVTIEEIAEAAGVSRALVYNYFGDKGGVVAAVYLRTFRRLDTEINDLVKKCPGSPKDQVRAAIRHYLSFARENPGAWKLIGTAETTVHPAVEQARRTRYEEMGRTWGGSPEARMLAHGIVGFLEAATLDWLEGPSSSIERAATVIQAMLWSGLSGLGAKDIKLSADEHPTEPTPRPPRSASAPVAGS